MNRKLVFALALTLLIGMLNVAFNVQRVRASGTIYIRANGSIDPPGAPILNVGNVYYTFTADIHDSIVVERNNIIIDGNRRTLQGSGLGTGISISGSFQIVRENVTIKNTTIKNYNDGIQLGWSSNNSVSGNNITANNGDGIDTGFSSGNSISGNNITANNGEGIVLYSSNYNSIGGNNVANNGDGIGLHSSSGNSVSGNNITANNGGIGLATSSNNNLSSNKIANNEYGIYIVSSSGNSISGNNIANNDEGIHLSSSSSNSIFHNNFINNTKQVYSSYSVNTWDDGYPSGGNYWSNYEARYPNATEINDSGIWNTPYVIDANNKDNFPIIPEFPSLLILPLLMIATLSAVITCKRKHKPKVNKG
jgi:parallel beta-helix repeat protein